MSEELKRSDIYIKEEITDQVEINTSDQRQEMVVRKQPLYQPSRCSKTYTKAELDEHHAPIHNGEKAKGFYHSLLI